LANRRWVIGVGAIVLVVCVGSVGLYPFVRDSAYEIQKLIEPGYALQRPGGGRLSAAPFAPLYNASAAGPDLGRAQLLLLHQPESKTRHRLQGLLYLAAGEWQKFVALTNDPSSQLSGDPAALNNLGVCFIALSENDPTLLLNAMDAFELASKKDPKAAEPVFNLVVTYRKLRLARLADESLRRYSAMDSESPWHVELVNPRRMDQATVLEQFEHSVETNNLAEAERLFDANPELYRRTAMQHALYNQPESPAVLRFIAKQMEHGYRDKTVSAMIAPLFTEQRDVTIELRRLVNRGAELYADGKFQESLLAYAEASEMARKTDSVFDRLWLDLNKVDTQIRVGQFNAVRETLARTVSIAGGDELTWLKAKALSVYGSTLRLTSSYTDMLDLLSNANNEFIRLDAPHDRIRVLYYLSAYRYYGGDQNEALRLALDCLRLVENDDAFRISTLDWLVASILYRQGMLDKSLLFAKESAEQSQKGPYANGIEFVSSTTLAGLYDSMSQHQLADEYLKLAEEAFKKIPQKEDQIRSELLLDIVKGKVKINQKKYAEAESLLQKNLDLYSQQPFSATPFLSQTLMLLAQAYSETGRIKEAGRKFTEAIDVIERDDAYMKSEGFRVKFDDERRELYDSAIDFEFRTGSLNAAWTYLQKYRAKLFLEFLVAFNPNIQPTRARLDPTRIQERIPKDTQIVEYALLKDRLLISVVAENLFVMRSVSVTRSEIESKIQDVLQKLRMEDDVDQLLADLDKVLIEPVRDLLDANRTLTIIPDRALHGLPFGALKPLGKAPYLIQQFPIVVSPSLTHFLSSNGAQPPRDGIVGFGSQNGGSSEFKELSALGDIYPKATTFIGQQVDKSSFLDGLKRASVFHYAGHSATDAVDPLRSSILLDGNRSGPNSVTAVDISQQRLPNNAVVILSSCDSSVGNSRDGIGVRGLTSAFLIGGAGSVVGSLWPVEAVSTADLMIRFHRAFARDDMPVSKALREAQLSFLKTFPERSHPYYWSGFVVTGNFSALR
jgi:CHAT domain-containing protein